MSLMYREGIIDGGGNMERERFYITGDVYVSRNDVREYQLAKSAICSGIQTLMKEADTDISEIGRVIIAGGLGFYIDEKNAVSTGLLPGEFPCKIEAAGNSAIDGARKALLDKTFLERCKEFAKWCTLIDLNKNKFFADKFIENMMFAE